MASRSTIAPQRLLRRARRRSRWHPQTMAPGEHFEHRIHNAVAPIRLVVVDSLQLFDEVDMDSEPHRHSKDLQELADGMTFHGRIVMLIAYQWTGEAFG